MLPASATASAIWRSRSLTRRPIRSVHFIRYLAEWLGVCLINRTNQLCQSLASTKRKFQVRSGRTQQPEGRIGMVGPSASTVSIVLVHGGFVDGAGWEGVYN